MRLWAWIAIIALVLLGRILHNDNLTIAAEPVALCLLWLASPRVLRNGIGLVLIVSILILALLGKDWMLQLLPALIAAFVGWLFARSLLPGHRPFIACAIAAIDGVHYLAEPQIARYAIGLTRVWAVFQGLLAVFGILCAVRAHGALSLLALPAPQTFAIILPLAVAALFFGEFMLRSRLVPAAPQHRLMPFLREMARVWPDLVEE